MLNGYYMWQSWVEIEHYSVAHFPNSKSHNAVLPLQVGLILAM